MSLDSAHLRAALADLFNQDDALHERQKLAEQELMEIAARRDLIRRAIASIQVVQQGLPELPHTMILADSIRYVLYWGFPTYLTIPEIRDRLQMHNYQLEKHANVLASINSVLKRFVDAGDVEEVKGGADGAKTKYRLTPTAKTKINPDDFNYLLKPSKKPKRVRPRK